MVTTSSNFVTNCSNFKNVQLSQKLYCLNLPTILLGSTPVMWYINVSLFIGTIWVFMILWRSCPRIRLLRFLGIRMVIRYCLKLWRSGRRLNCGINFIISWLDFNPPGFTRTDGESHLEAEAVPLSVGTSTFLNRRTWWTRAWSYHSPGIIRWVETWISLSKRTCKDARTSKVYSDYKIISFKNIKIIKIAMTVIMTFNK